MFFLLLLTCPLSCLATFLYASFTLVSVPITTVRATIRHNYITTVRATIRQNYGLSVISRCVNMAVWSNCQSLSRWFLHIYDIHGEVDGVSGLLSAKDLSPLTISGRKTCMQYTYQPSREKTNNVVSQQTNNVVSEQV